jgi:hypothetical protein
VQPLFDSSRSPGARQGSAVFVPLDNFKNSLHGQSCHVLCSWSATLLSITRSRLSLSDRQIDPGGRSRSRDRPDANFTSHWWNSHLVKVDGWQPWLAWLTPCRPWAASMTFAGQVSQDLKPHADYYAQCLLNEGRPWLWF